MAAHDDEVRIITMSGREDCVSRLAFKDLNVSNEALAITAQAILYIAEFRKTLFDGLADLLARFGMHFFRLLMGNVQFHEALGKGT